MTVLEDILRIQIQVSEVSPMKTREHLPDLSSSCMHKPQGELYFRSPLHLLSSLPAYSILDIKYFTNMPLIVTWVAQDVILVL